jgi:putative membrane protein
MTALGLLAFGCSHSQSGVPSYGGAQGQGPTREDTLSDTTETGHDGDPSMNHAPAPSETAVPTGASPPGQGQGAEGATNAQPTASPARQTWGGTADTPTSDTQYGPAAAAGSTTDISGLSDAQLAAIVEAINRGEIQEAQVAVSHASTPGVKQFASHMIDAHRALLASAKATLSRAHIAPSDNAVSNDLKSDAASQVSTLRGLRGRDFDRTYIDGQVRGHTQALEIIDRILPNVRDPDLKNEIQNARPRVESHLREAERLERELGSAGPAGMSP